MALYGILAAAHKSNQQHPLTGMPHRQLRLLDLMPRQRSEALEIVTVAFHGNQVVDAAAWQL
eukprot:3048502-Amphidinium_carterae.1